MSDIKGGNLVEKSRQLVWAKFTDYTAGELRLLEVYLSRKVKSMQQWSGLEESLNLCRRNSVKR